MRKLIWLFGIEYKENLLQVRTTQLPSTFPFYIDEEKYTNNANLYYYDHESLAFSDTSDTFGWLLLFQCLEVLSIRGC